MIYKATQIKDQRFDAARGGQGFLTTRALISGDEFCGKGRMFNYCVLEPGSSVGNHGHEGEIEVYYILKGEGTYNDNGEDVSVCAGDVTYCDDGQVHGIVNSGKEDLEFMALILFTK